MANDATHLLISIETARKRSEGRRLQLGPGHTAKQVSVSSVEESRVERDRVLQIDCVKCQAMISCVHE